MDKTEGEASLRVRGCTPGQGVRAYMVIYKWFMGTSGQAVTDRIKRLMSPTTPKTEADIADAIERWVESGRTLECLKQEYRLPDVFKVTALEQLMGVGQAKLHFESIKSQDADFDIMLQKCRDYAHQLLKRSDLEYIRQPIFLLETFKRTSRFHPSLDGVRYVCFCLRRCRRHQFLDAIRY